MPLKCLTFSVSPLLFVKIPWLCRLTDELIKATLTLTTREITIQGKLQILFQMFKYLSNTLEQIQK